MSDALYLAADIDTDLSPRNLSDVLRALLRERGRGFSRTQIAGVEALATAIELHAKPAPDGIRATATLDAEAGGALTMGGDLSAFTRALIRDATKASGLSRLTQLAVTVVLCGDATEADDSDDCDGED